MSNPFSLLATENSASSDDDSECVLAMGNSSHNVEIEDSIPKQNGGSFAQRLDPLTGICFSSTLQLDLGISDSDISTTTRVISVLTSNIQLFKLSKFKGLRAALHPLIIEQMKNYDPKESNNVGNCNEKRSNKRKRHKSGYGASTIDELHKLQKQKLDTLEEAYINQTQLRALRLQQLEELNKEGYVPRVPDGAAICTSAAASHEDVGAASAAVMLLECGSSVSSGALLTAESYSSSSRVPPPPVMHPISCYICHKPYTDLHFFYHQLCPDCAIFNFSKRTEICNMRGKCCIVTGGRTKIGYRSALKLLQCGAHVIVTTRFPRDAAVRFAAENDSSQWLHKLDIYGLDFRDISRLEVFCAYVSSTYDRLDAIVNNACQTVRRPPAYYAHLMKGEREYAESHLLLKDNEFAATLSTPASKQSLDKVLQRHHSFGKSSCDSSVFHSPNDGMLLVESGAATSTSINAISDSCGRNNSSSSSSSACREDRTVTMAAEEAVPAAVATSRLFPTTTTSSSAEVAALNASSEMSQLILVAGDEQCDVAQFPDGILDVNRQQVDLRKHNSWTMKLHEVSTPELVEVMAINVMAPTILNSRLKSMMERNKSDLKFIVNVSAMEGKFYRFKSETHPHTNMAKAALNMMTRTSAQDYVKSNIFMTAVDTGWINDEKPIERAVAHEKKHKFQTPLDEIDAASRVLDPIIAPLLAKEKGELCDPPWGIFLKDYMKTEW